MHLDGKAEYHRGNSRVAIHKNGVLSYLHSDHLGSLSVATSITGTKVAEQRYDPFGGLRPGGTGSSRTDKLYTGQPLDGETDLYYYGARYYDGNLGRFIQPDTIVPQPGNAQSLNRYAYALNNPVKYNDPTGHCGPLTPICFVLFLTGMAMAVQDDTIMDNEPPPPPEAIFTGNVGMGLMVVGATGQLGYALVTGPVGGEAMRQLQMGSMGAERASRPIAGQASPFARSLTLERAIESAQNAAVRGRGQGFNSFADLKRELGSAGPGQAWHHIVEENPTNLSRFGAQRIHNTSNVIRLPDLPGSIHKQISGYYSSIDRDLTGSATMRVRDWLSTQSFEFQWRFGIEMIIRFGGGQHINQQFGGNPP